MKYSLYKELMNEKNVLSHVFFNCANDFIISIADKNKGKDKEWIEKRKIDIELKIDGNVCDPKKFFDLLMQQYDNQVRIDATKLVKEQTTEKLSEIQDKIQGLEEVLKYWVNDINWNIENPLIKNT